MTYEPFLIMMSRSRLRKGGGRKQKEDPIPVRRSSRAAASCKNYNEDQMFREVQDRALLEETIKASKAKQVSRGSKRRAEKEEEDDKEEEVKVVEVDDDEEEAGGSQGDEEGSDGEEEEEEEEEDDDEGPEMPLPRIIARRELTAADWREVCTGMDTKEITRG